MNSDQRRRARGLDAHAGSLQIQQIGKPGCQKVLVVAGVPQQEHAYRLDELWIGQQVVGKIGLHTAAAKNTDSTGKLRRHVAGIFQCFPGAFKEMAMLGIENGGVALAEAEKFSIKHLHFRKHHAGAYIVRVIDVCVGYASLAKFVGRHPLSGFPAFAQHLPELGC